MAAQSFNKNLRLILIIAAILTGVIIFFPLLKFIQQKLKFGVDKASSAIDNFSTTTVAGRYNYPIDQVKAITTIVKSIHGAYHDSTVDEDEDTAIRNLNGLKTVTQVHIASDLYKSLYNSSLKAESERYLSDGLMSLPGYLGWTPELNRVNQIVKDNWF